MKSDKLLISTKELQERLSCSRQTAEKIGNQAGAKINLGRAVRWKIKNIEEYLEKKEVIEG